MGEELILDERRKHRRFRARDGAIAVLRTIPARLGQILDVSRGGLAFSCMDEHGGKHPAAAELRISYSKEDFKVDSIPFETRGHCVMPSKVPFSTTIMHRYGVEFVDLSIEQERMLKLFISKDTLDFA